jgi:hypothetical protein
MVVRETDGEPRLLTGLRLRSEFQQKQKKTYATMPKCPAVSKQRTSVPQIAGHASEDDQCQLRRRKSV